MREEYYRGFNDASCGSAFDATRSEDYQSGWKAWQDMRERFAGESA